MRHERGQVRVGAGQVDGVRLRRQPGGCAPPGVEITSVDNHRQLPSIVGACGLLGLARRSLPANGSRESASYEPPIRETWTANPRVHP